MTVLVAIVIIVAGMAFLVAAGRKTTGIGPILIGTVVLAATAILAGGLVYLAVC